MTRRNDLDTARMERSGRMLALVFVSTVMLALNATMLSIALPTVVADLGATAVQGNWMLLSYLVVYGSALVLMGQLSDSSDKRTVFLSGLAVFTLASLGLSLAQGPLAFIALRAVQGAGAAMLLSTAAAMIAVVYPPSRLSGPMGIYLSGFAIAQVAGPNIGGVIVTLVGWRLLFLVNVPIGIVALVWGWRLLKRLPASDRPPGRRFDPWGNGLILIGMTALLFALSQVQRSGWIDGIVLGCIAVFVGCVPAFILVERRVENPAIDIDLLKDRAFALANYAGFALAIPRLVTALLLSLYFQGLEGDDPLVAALKITPLALAVAAGSLTVRRVARAADDRRDALGFAIASAVGVAVLMLALREGGSLGGLILGMVVMGFSTGVFSALNSSIIMRSVPRTRAGNVNGVRTTFQVAGLSIGTALSLSLVTGALAAPQSQAFLSGDASALSAQSRALLGSGYQLAFGTMLLLVLAAVAASAALTRDSPPQPPPSGPLWAGLGRKPQPRRATRGGGVQPRAGDVPSDGTERSL